VTQVHSNTPSSGVAIVGAGPYGLAAAAHLRHAGVDVRVIGEPMEFWRKQMPKGMMLRSRKRSSHIANPDRSLMLDDHGRMNGGSMAHPTLAEFLDYATWFQGHVAPDIDTRKVERIDRHPGGYRLTLRDGDEIDAERVVIAAGLFPFAWRPAPFDKLPSSYVSHASEHDDLSRFAGQEVIVVGGGQSALESAALLHESGARVEVIARAPSILWLREDEDGGRPSLHQRMLPRTDVGGRATGWLAAAPDAFRRLPADVQPTLSYRCIKPAGAPWLVPRLADVPITTEHTVTSAAVDGDRVVLELEDGTERNADHVLLGTGYRVDVSRYPFLPPELTESLELSNGYPVLRPGLESSSHPGLHFLGAPAALSFGPIMRFVVGTWYAAPALTHHVLGKRPRFSSSLPVRPWSNGSSG
jgi:hypothetical protein